MVIKKVNLDIVVGVTSTLPETSFPEVAFAGKSNVGKSSLINALMNRKSYARTSSQPGKTQTINFYNINDSMYLVDLPGYGDVYKRQGFTNEAGSCLVSYAVTNKGNAYVFCTGGATYRWAPVYDEIYVYKNIIPASAKDLETETTKMSPNN